MTLWPTDPWYRSGEIRDTRTTPPIGFTRTCPDCGRPQHYTGTENGWCHDAGFDLLACGASPALIAELEK